MRILVTGRDGQLGFDVIREGRSKSLEMIGTGRAELNITDKDAVLKAVTEMRPDAIIHCAAYTAVDQAETDREACWAVNVEGTRNLAAAAVAIGAKFMYISTDYVFDGQGETPFEESDPSAPIGYYGSTKYEGELAVQSMLDHYFIVRISWVFGVNGNNFVKTMLRLAESRPELNVVNDQVGSPTYTVDLAKLLVRMIQTDRYGVYHATNEGYCSWADFSMEIFRQAGKDVVVHGIATDQYPTPAKRPANSRLSKQKLEEQGFDRLPHWKDALERYLKELSQEVNI